MVGRVTQGMINTQFLRNLHNNLSRLDHMQNQMATGRTINKPSDDPVGMSFAMRYRSDLAANEQYVENVDSALSWLEFTDSMLGQTGDVLHRVRELSVQAANSSNPEAALNNIKSEILELTEQLVTIGNSRFNGKYIFNGQITDQPPYQEGIDYNGTAIPAESGRARGNVDVSLANVSAADNVLNIRIDGEAVSVTLPPNDYSGTGAAALAADLQAQINAATTTADVTVTANVNDELVITSNSTGAASEVTIFPSSFAQTWLSAAGDLSDVTQSPGVDGVAVGYEVQARYDDADNAEIQFEIAPGVRIPVNLSGNKVFGASTDDTNLYQLMNKLSDLLDAQDTAGISDLLGDMDARLNTLLETRAELGAKINRVELANERLKDITLNLQTLQSKTEDADMAELITKVKTEENIYQASLSVGSRIIRPSLVDFLN